MPGWAPPVVDAQSDALVSRFSWVVAAAVPVTATEPTPLLHGGWKVLPWHTLPSKLRACAGLNATYAVTRHHPGGVLIKSYRYAPGALRTH